MLLDVGEDRLSKSMDIVTFIRNQIMMKSTIRSMLSPQARYLSKNQKKFALDSESSTSSGNSNSDFDPDDPALLKSSNALQLAQGVTRKM